jgi:drug/metabolite transporter (DMT)-like permease
LKERESHILRGTLCTTIGGIFWGFSGACGQYLFANYELSPLWLTCIRLLIAGTVLTGLAAVRQRKKLLAVVRSPRETGRITLYGVFGLMMCQFSYLTSIRHSNAGTTTVLQNLNMVLIMLLTCLRLRRRPDRREMLALILALAGTYILATGGDPRHMVLTGAGLFWGLMTAVAAATYTLLPRKLLPKWGWEIVTGLGMLTGGIVLSLAARIWRVSVQLPAAGWVAVMGVTVLGSIVAFPLFMQGIEDVGPVRSSMLAATEPVSATLISAVWLGTQFPLSSLIGFACILVTIFLLAKNA